MSILLTWFFVGAVCVCVDMGGGGLSLRDRISVNLAMLLWLD